MSTLIIRIIKDRRIHPVRVRQLTEGQIAAYERQQAIQFVVTAVHVSRPQYMAIHHGNVRVRPKWLRAAQDALAAGTTTA